MDSAVQIAAGTTAGLVELSRTKSGVYVLALKADLNPENRFVKCFVLALLKAFDAVEADLETQDGPSALLTISGSKKFFSNGVDPPGSAYSKRCALPSLSKVERTICHLDGVGMTASD